MTPSLSAAPNWPKGAAVVDEPRADGTYHFASAQDFHEERIATKRHSAWYVAGMISMDWDGFVASFDPTAIEPVTPPSWQSGLVVPKGPSGP